MYITESLCCPAEINTTLQINYTSIKIFLCQQKSMETKFAFTTRKF